VLQLRLFSGKSFLDDIELEMEMQSTGLFFTPDGRRLDREEHFERKHGSALFLTFGLYDGVAGWECRGTKQPLDFGLINHYPAEAFFVPAVPRGDTLVLRAGSFYILSTLESVLVPTHLSAELRAIDPRLGDARVHAAGYIDPGWGVAKEESTGQPITLEVIPYEGDTLWRVGQRVARIRYERMLAAPEVSYWQAASHYVGQKGPRLSKHFKTAA
jgi:dCTP deaminase